MQIRHISRRRRRINWSQAKAAKWFAYIHIYIFFFVVDQCCHLAQYVLINKFPTARDLQCNLRKINAFRFYNWPADVAGDNGKVNNNKQTGMWHAACGMPSVACVYFCWPNIKLVAAKCQTQEVLQIFMSPTVDCRPWPTQSSIVWVCVCVCGYAC